MTARSSDSHIPLAEDALGFRLFDALHFRPTFLARALILRCSTLFISNKGFAQCHKGGRQKDERQAGKSKVRGQDTGIVIGETRHLEKTRAPR